MGKPKEAGQSGYAMLVNYGRGIKENSRVTVILGNFKRTNVNVY